MAYKYFTKRLLQEGNIDLASVFPISKPLPGSNVMYLTGSRKQLTICGPQQRILNSPTSGILTWIMQCVLLLDVTIFPRIFVIRFEESGEAAIEDEYVEGNEPKKAAIVADGKTKQKAVPEQKFKAPVSDIEEEQIAVAAAVPPAPVMIRWKRPCCRR
jgi:hypothetical protein